MDPHQAPWRNGCNAPVAARTAVPVACARALSSNAVALRRPRHKTSSQRRVQQVLEIAGSIGHARLPPVFSVATFDSERGFFTRGLVFRGHSVDIHDQSNQVLGSKTDRAGFSSKCATVFLGAIRGKPDMLEMRQDRVIDTLRHRRTVSDRSVAS
jgi:hypothetical protein